MRKNKIYDKFEAEEMKGGKISFTATDDLLMIHSDTMGCQFSRKTIMPMLDEAGTHGILRFVDKQSLNLGMTLFIKNEFLVGLVMFLQKYTSSTVVLQN